MITIIVFYLTVKLRVVLFSGFEITLFKINHEYNQCCSNDQTSPEFFLPFYAGNVTFKSQDRY